MSGVVIHTAEEIVRIRIAAQATAWVREELRKQILPGMSTLDVDRLAGMLIMQTGGTSSFLGYNGFPGNICVSINDTVVHGIGSDNVIIGENDILSIDLGVTLNGATGDTAITLAFRENLPEEVKNLLHRTEESLHAGIKQARKGNFVRNISAAVEAVGKKAKLGIVRQYVGHGCGIKLHEEPEIPNFVVPGNRGPRLVPGMVLAIEPMFNLGSHQVYIEPDRWTVRTRDGSLSAHFEHQVLITENEPEILTCPKM
ncbi:MAG: type I methionyl aminopeptidase [Victivallaceae bacterium]|jgi:methionyl aminopeptidase|nr:type I methionyl aminopeptidase [Victivallaceae bacterium]NLK82705.1 type I methionyl aminopeptidase [Lentisphaerota bacterium]MDD3116807.1 type I methionyl aminopeptidase [Victivallaceae bacterium]MDD3702775.1 type I methionyl aminopeptidase [Victivallaceae bacterium]MDD4317465.1 type I methionyl aminopeptidase [Victivallaceae bacterium]